MRSASYALVACPLLLALFVLLCWSLRYLHVSSHDDWAHYARIAFVAQMLLVFFWLFRWVRAVVAYNPRRRLSYVEHAPMGTDKFGVPLMEEAVKLFSMVLFVFLGSPARQSRVSYVYVVASVYAFNFLVASLVEFCPINGKTRFKKFLATYDIYESQMLGSMKKRPSFASAELNSSTLAPVNPAPTPVFNLNSFGSKALAHSVLMPIMNQQIMDCNDDMIERLYSVSPKNTLHFLLGDYGSDIHGPTLAAQLVQEDAASLHTTDTHFGGGGGGNFKYKMPDGSKLEFGGGAGFDYKHGSNTDSDETSNRSKHSDKQSTHSVNSLDESNSRSKSLSGSLESSTSCNSTLSTTPCNPYAWNVQPTKHERTCEMRRLIQWFRWLIPNVPTEDELNNVSPRALRFSIRKKLSTYTLSSETTSLKSGPGRLYGTFDLESQLAPRQCKSFRCKTENVHAYYEFAKFGNRFFDVWAPRLVEFYNGVDPAFYRFGTLLSHLLTFYYIIYGASICMWQFSSTLILAYPFVAPTPSIVTFMLLVTAVCVSKLFCINYLHNQATCSYRVSLVVEFVINLVLLTLAYLYYLGL